MVVGMSFPLAGAIGNWQNRQLAARTFLPTGGGGGGGGGARSQVGGGGAFLLWHRSDTATNTGLPPTWKTLQECKTALVIFVDGHGNW